VIFFSKNWYFIYRITEIFFDKYLYII